jgi:hypothetical protein
MSRILVGEMAGADEELSFEVGPMWLNFWLNPNYYLSNLAWILWTRWSFQNDQFSSSGHIMHCW